MSTNTDVEQWKPGTLLIEGDSMVAGLREAKLSRNRKAKVRFFLAILLLLLLLFSFFAEEGTR